jgi:hypothetical protein
MKIKITQSVATNWRGFRKGEICEVPEAVAKDLIHCNSAIRLAEEPQQLETRDTQRKKNRKRVTSVNGTN